MPFFRLLALMICLALVRPALAEMPERVDLAPLDFPPASLTVRGPDGETVYDRATLEQTFDTYRLVTTTPWRTDPAAFEGILLSDLVARHGLEGAATLRVTAENDYEVTIPAEIVAEVPILIATRVDGQPHVRRARGPLQFVIPSDIFAELGLTERYLVWMASIIEPAE